MKVVAYGIQSYEREFLAKANKKKHDITLIGNPLTEETLYYAVGKQAVVLPENIVISKELSARLLEMGVVHVFTRADCIDENEKSVLHHMAVEVIRQLDLL